jgi:hypothetical protein
MKNQFFGDINDYMKYGLLRILSGGKRASAAVCWMLTPDTGGGDGKRTGYLRKPSDWNHFDHNLFYALQQAVIIYDDRNVTRAEDPAILDPKVFAFYKETLKDDIDQRRDYFKKFLSLAGGRDLVFFDPDNGLEVKSTPRGRKDSSKFLYFEELSKTFSMGHSVLVFQFFMMRKAEDVISEKTSQIFSCLDVNEIATFKTDSVIYFLVPQPKHSNELRERSQRVPNVWGTQIVPNWHSRRSAH